MKYLITILFLFVSVAVGAQDAESVVVEPGAKFRPPALGQMKNRQEFLNTTAALIRHYGYTCDSISAVMRPAFYAGEFHVACNRRAHRYWLIDQDGQWTVEVDHDYDYLGDYDPYER